MYHLNHVLENYAKNRYGNKWLDVTFHLPERGSVLVRARRQTGSGVKHYSTLICARCGTEHMGFNHACPKEVK